MFESSAIRILLAVAGVERMRCQSLTLSSMLRLSRWYCGTMFMYAARHAATWILAMAFASVGVAVRILMGFCCKDMFKQNDSGFECDEGG